MKCKMCADTGVEIPLEMPKKLALSEPCKYCSSDDTAMDLREVKPRHALSPWDHTHYRK